MKKTDINLVKEYIRKSGWTEIKDDFIEGWFDFFNTKGATPEKIGEDIIGEYDFATTDLPNLTD